MLNKPEQLLEAARAMLAEAGSEADIEAVRIKFLGKKGELTAILRSMGALSPEERKELGLKANTVRDAIEAAISEGKERLGAAERDARLLAETLDVTEPGRKIPRGHKHPLTRTIEEISAIFADMGYTVTEGPEVETVFNNFDALNAAPDHPSRDLSDTFYITESTLLRTQTSPV